MSVIAVINRKGGSGKSTLSTHIAAWLAQQGACIMLGDVDRQQSARSWLKRRNASLATILPWNIESTKTFKVPVSVDHLVLDTPGGIHGLELAKVVMWADVILMPICGSIFDRDSASDCFTELKSLPRITSGRCKIGVIGMRLDGKTQSVHTLQAWAQERKLAFIGTVNDRAVYGKILERGLTLFDLYRPSHSNEMREWDDILTWLSAAMHLDTDTANGIAHEPHHNVISIAGNTTPAEIATPAAAPQATPITPLPQPLEAKAAKRSWLTLPRFLRRG